MRRVIIAHLPAQVPWWFMMGAVNVHAGLPLQVMEGMQEGTLFDRDVVEAEEAASARGASCPGSEDEDACTSGRDMALQARAASRCLQAAPTEVRGRAGVGCVLAPPEACMDAPAHDAGHSMPCQPVSSLACACMPSSGPAPLVQAAHTDRAYYSGSASHAYAGGAANGCFCRAHRVAWSLGFFWPLVLLCAAAPAGVSLMFCPASLAQDHMLLSGRRTVCRARPDSVAPPAHACAQTRVRILRKIADDLESHEALILERNGRDVAAAGRRKIDAHLLQRLRLRPEKLRTLARGIRAIADLEEPLRKARERGFLCAIHILRFRVGLCKGSRGEGWVTLLCTSLLLLHVA